MSMTIKRVFAYLFDIIVVYLVIMAISVSPLNPNYEKTSELEEEYSEKYQALLELTSEESVNEEEFEDDFNEFTDYTVEVLHKENKLSVYENIYTVTLMILYFAVFAYFFEGETVGKRLFKIRVVDKNGNKPKFWQLLVRTIVLFGIPITILNSLLAYVLGKTSFMYVNMGLYVVNMILSVAILITFFVTKDHLGLHDLIAGTKVIGRK